jgi:hypothetical protein
MQQPSYDWFDQPAYTGDLTDPPRPAAFGLAPTLSPREVRAALELRDRRRAAGEKNWDRD